MKEKIIKSAHGHDVSVKFQRSVDRNGLHSVKITARAGSSVHEMRPKWGSVDGARPAPPTVEEMTRQLAVDAQAAADHASFKEHVRLALDQVEKDE